MVFIARKSSVKRFGSRALVLSALLSVCAVSFLCGGGAKALAQGERHIASPKDEARQNTASEAGGEGAFPPPPGNTASAGDNAIQGGGDSAGRAALWPSAAAAQQASQNMGSGQNAANMGAAQSSAAVPAADPQNLQQMKMQIEALQNKLQSLENASGQPPVNGGSAAAAGAGIPAAPLTAPASADISAEDGQNQFMNSGFGGGNREDDENYAVPPNINADILYQAAQDAMAQGQYGKAASMWKAFAERFGSDARAGNAAFMEGECYYARGLYGKAAEIYLNVRRLYPNEPFAAQVLLQLALSMSNLQDKPTACATLAQLKKQYPHADDVITEQREQVSARLQCP